MKILVKNTEYGLIPMYDSDLEEKKKLTLDQEYWGEFKKARNYKFLKKFMALIRYGNENSKTVEMPFDAYREYITMKAGYFEHYSTPTKTFFRAKSIAFDNMDEETFQDVYSRVLDEIIKDTEATKEDIEKELSSFL
jgi:hypothetical protein